MTEMPTCRAAFWSSRRVLVTGAAGFIGSNLCRRLVNLGATVSGVDNLERGKLEFVKPLGNALKLTIADVSDKVVAQDCMSDIDTVFHLASKVGGIGYYVSYSADVIAANTAIDMTVFQAALENDVNRYFYASSGHVYPKELQASPDAPAILETQATPANPELSYGWAKLYGEKLIQYRMSQGCVMRAAIARIVGAFGPNQDFGLQTGSVIPVFCRRAIDYPKGAPFVIWGTGRETRSYCYVDDVIDAMLIAVEELDHEQIVGPFNLGTEETISIAELAQLVIGISGKTIDVQYDSSKPTAIWGQRVDCSLASKILRGWASRTSLSQGVLRTYEDIAHRLAISEMLS
jgi:nucleoside-diphosphate-sugar epimerase